MRDIVYCYSAGLFGLLLLDVYGCFVFAWLFRCFDIVALRLLGWLHGFPWVLLCLVVCWVIVLIVVLACCCFGGMVFDCWYLFG